MSDRTQQRLSYYLEQLSKEQLKTFQHQLLKETAWPEASGTKVASGLVAQYGNHQAWNMALHTWEKMGMTQLFSQAQQGKDLTLTHDPSFLSFPSTSNVEFSSQLASAGLRPDYQSSSDQMSIKKTLVKKRTKFKCRTRETAIKTCQNQRRESPCHTRSWETEGFHQKYTQLLLLQKSCPRGQRSTVREGGHQDIKDRGHLIAIQDLFDPSPGSQKKPQLVILEGAAGIGKSMLARQVRRAWGEGRLYRDRFRHVFYFSCRELAQCEQLSLAELIAKYENVHKDLIEEILSHSKKLLFILDGIDEPAWVLQKPKFYRHWSQSQPVHTLLGSLLGKSLLPKASLLLTARTTELQTLIPSLEQPRWVEVLGFSESGRKKYFYTYFAKEREAITAFALVESNPVLLTLCLVPWVSWIVCTCLKQQMVLGGDLSLTSQTTTALCLKYLSQTLPAQSLGARLRGLCSLAAEGICRKKSLFSVKDLRKQKVPGSVISTLMTTGVLQRQPNSTTYSFAHLCLQEFFAAMSCVLSYEEDSCENFKAVEKLTEVHGRLDLVEAPTMRFLCGLLSDQAMDEMRNIVTCWLPLERRWELLKRVLEEAHLQHSYSLGLLHCLYEIQDAELLTRAMHSFQGARVHVQTDMVHPGLQADVKHLVIQTDVDLMVVAFCIKFCHQVKALQLDGGGRQGQVLRGPRLVLSRWTPVTNATWQVFFSTLEFTGSLEELDLSGNPMSYSAVQSLCRMLRHAECHLKTLWLVSCGITASSCGDLASVLSTNCSLTELDLQLNDLGDQGVKLLCEGLRNPACNLRILRLDSSSLNDQVMEELKALKEENPKLLVQSTLDSSSLNDQVMEELKALKEENPKLLVQSTLDSSSLNDQVMEELKALKEENPKLLVQSTLDSSSLNDQVMEELKALKEENPKPLVQSTRQEAERELEQPESLKPQSPPPSDELLAARPLLPDSTASGRPSVQCCRLWKTSHSDCHRKPPVKVSTPDLDEGETSAGPSSLKRQKLQLEEAPKQEALPTAQLKLSHLLHTFPGDKLIASLKIEDSFWGSTGPLATEVVDSERNLYRVQFPMAGSYHWPSTGLRFVVTRATIIEIEFCAWSQFLGKTPLEQSHMVAGPLFDIKAEQGAVDTVYLPHFVALQGIQDTSNFQVAHFLKDGVVLETPAEVKPHCTVLKKPSFSTIGVMLKIIPVTRRFLPITSITLLYHQPHAEEHKFHLYLIPNDCTIRKAIDDEEMKFQFVRIHKPPPMGSLYVGSRYTVSGSGTMEITPKELELCYRSPTEAQLFSEIYVDCLQSGIRLEIKDKNAVVWETVLKPGDLRPASTLVAAAPTVARPFQHFVDQHREQLVARVTSVDPVLDRLHGQVLSEEQYETVRAEVTNPNKMRRLFSYSQSWDWASKSQFYQALKETHSHLIIELWEVWARALGEWVS
ncbi:NACHT, LRR and PYD domains-containing protein 1 [Chionomys nivalis]|uniref:NACHT, LRR and PYD domains-containing protein 1 n=1 Tax=Chionomys nivalis TaxID=269649 RepID=UPI00259605CB|nr:NACHT, LRR and PYD domains-containing protein 1 [Chionomys nivalis]XP_057632434.1 NACHT, LRR and PYD domains-containing protein 1 [Chionomys nivalis]